MPSVDGKSCAVAQTSSTDRVAIFRTPMVILTRRRAMRIFRLANIRQRRGYGGNSDASVLAIKIGVPTDRVRGFGPVRP